ncbi:MAG: transcriptional repressor [Pirellulales bacterium]|nr:transcriptional repressor [Pirellulales bacterium]
MAKRGGSDEAVDFRAEIRAAGLRCTNGRLAVLRRLQAAARPQTHAELAEHLVPEGYDKTTVYRNLIDLAEAGLVSRTELGDHLWRFELRRAGHQHENTHPHFLCTTCGELKCLEKASVSVEPQRAPRVIDQITEVLLKGRCVKCAGR